MKLKDVQVKEFKEEAVKVDPESAKADIAITFKDLNLSFKTLWTRVIPSLRSQVVLKPKYKSSNQMYMLLTPLVTIHMKILWSSSRCRRLRCSQNSSQTDHRMAFAWLM